MTCGWTGTPPAAGLADKAGIRIAQMHPHMLRTFVTTTLDAGVNLRDV